LRAAPTRYFIEVDGFMSIEPHPGPREAACAAALEQGRDANLLRVIAIEGEDPLSEAAKRTIYEYDSHHRRWAMRAR
jgi:hypothetical protein